MYPNITSKNLQPTSPTLCANTPPMSANDLEPRTAFDDLPDELLLRVFSYVGHVHLISTIPQVCLRWKSLHNDPSFYRSLVFTKQAPTTALALQILDLSPWLYSFTMSGRTDADEIVRHMGLNHPRLETLIIRHCHGRPGYMNIYPNYLRHVLNNSSKLKHLSLEGTTCELVFDSCCLYKEIGVQLPLLKIVNFGEVWDYFSSEALHNIVTNCSGVEEIQVNETSFPGTFDISVVVVVECCEKFRESLKILHLGNCIQWTDSSFQSLSKCYNLNKLTIDRAQLISDKGIMQLCHLPNLVDLTLWDADLVSSKGWVRFFNNPSMQNLQHLELECDNVNDEVVKVISVLPRVNDLTVRGSYVSDEGIMAIRLIPNLVDLSLSDADQVTSQGWIRFFDEPLRTKLVNLSLECRCVDDEVFKSIGMMSNLFKIDVCVGNATDAGLMAISELPELKVLSLFDDPHITSHGWCLFFHAPLIQTLNCLSLEDCKNIGDSVARVISKNLRDLRTLQFIRCSVTPQGLQEVQQQIPDNCTFICEGHGYM